MSVREGSMHKEEARVERVYSETRYHQRRVGRNRYVRGDAYTVWCTEVSLRGRWYKTLESGKRMRPHYRQGDTLSIDVGTGMLGIPVIRNR